MRKFIIIIFIAFFCQLSQAYANKTALVLNHADLADTIRLIAKFLRLNVIISPEVKGTVTLQSHEQMDIKMLDFILTANGFSKWQKGNVWYVAPFADIIKQKQQQVLSQETNLNIAPLMQQFWQLRYAKADTVQKLLQGGTTSFLSKRGISQIDERTNMLYVRDVNANLVNIAKFIARIDVPVKQILIEARLVSIDSDYEYELGFNFASYDTNQEQNNLAKGGNHQYGLTILKLAKQSLLDVKLSALENSGHAKLISSPSLFTSNQQEAAIETGEEIPYQEVSESGGTAVVFKKAVLGLKVTPQILPGNNVLLRLQINQDRPSNKMVLGVPTIRTRQILTNVLVKHGHTIVLGGIYESNREQGIKRVPILGDIPIIGYLFQLHNQRKNKRELLIFVTPKIIL